MTISQLMEIVLTAMGSIGLWILTDGVTQLRELRKSISELNENMAVIINRVDSHEKRITHLEGD